MEARTMFTLFALTAVFATVLLQSNAQQQPQVVCRDGEMCNSKKPCGPGRVSCCDQLIYLVATDGHGYQAVRYGTCQCCSQCLVSNSTAVQGSPSSGSGATAQSLECVE